jgi:hypothetical protein
VNSPLLLLGTLTLAGLVVALRPYEVARAKERLDALGSDRENDLGSVEPTPGNVFVFRAFGAGVATLGITFLLWLLFDGPTG